MRKYEHAFAFALSISVRARACIYVCTYINVSYSLLSSLTVHTSPWDDLLGIYHSRQQGARP